MKRHFFNKVFMLHFFISSFTAHFIPVFSQESLLTQRQISLQEMMKRPDEPWPRGDGHIVLGEPGSPTSQKAYHEPGGSFSPSPGSFGVSFWIMDSNNHLVATSDNIPVKDIQQHYIWKGEDKIPSVETTTPYYHCIWSYSGLGQWKADLTKTNNSGNLLYIVFRSVGPAGGAVESLNWDGSRLLINHSWIVTANIPMEVELGDEQKTGILQRSSRKEFVNSANGWAFAKFSIGRSSISLKIRNTKPQYASPLHYQKTIPLFSVNLPDKRFEESIKAQVSNLMMGYVGQQTCPGEPVNYPLAWERDGAYSLISIARSGHLQTAKDLSVFFAENDFFGGFGAEGDAAGSAINALVEIALLLNDTTYYNWLWPHIKRKTDIIYQMHAAKDTIKKAWIGPLVPDKVIYTNASPICLPAKNGLIVGAMDLHFPVLYINAVSYRGLIQAARLANVLNKTAEAGQYIQKAKEIQTAWMNAFPNKEYNNERNFMISIWPSWIINKDFAPFTKSIEEEWTASRDGKGYPKNRPLWTYFNVANAHQWLFLDRTDRVWNTLNYFWDNQCSPGLYTYWEGNGEENSFKTWDNYRGWLKPKYVTPHYWTASEMLLLQLDMLVYIDESGNKPEIVVGGGIPENWMNQEMNVENFTTKAGTICWNYKNNLLKVTVKGSKEKYKVRVGSSFQKNAKINIEYK
jgi:hypothetical protein